MLRVVITENNKGQEETFGGEGYVYGIDVIMVS